MDLRNSRLWDRQLEVDLPDSRLSSFKREQTLVRLGRLEYERVFCANCGAPGGGVTPEWSPHVFYVCDDCAHRLGPPAGCIEVKPHDAP
jgi:hypothetical protein